MGPHKTNDGKHIDFIISQTACSKHDAPQGFACFEVYYGNSRRGDKGPAVCGTRIINTGFNGKISSTSLSRTAKSRT